MKNNGQLAARSVGQQVHKDVSRRTDTQHKKKRGADVPCAIFIPMANNCCVVLRKEERAKEGK